MQRPVSCIYSRETAWRARRLCHGTIWAHVDKVCVRRYHWKIPRVKHNEFKEIVEMLDEFLGLESKQILCKYATNCVVKQSIFCFGFKWRKKIFGSLEYWFPCKKNPTKTWIGHTVCAINPEWGAAGNFSSVFSGQGWAGESHFHSLWVRWVKVWLKGWTQWLGGRAREERTSSGEAHTLASPLYEAAATTVRQGCIWKNALISDTTTLYLGSHTQSTATVSQSGC